MLEFLMILFAPIVLVGSFAVIDTLCRALFANPNPTLASQLRAFEYAQYVARHKS